MEYQMEKIEKMIRVASEIEIGGIYHFLCGYLGCARLIKEGVFG